MKNKYPFTKQSLFVFIFAFLSNTAIAQQLLENQNISYQDYIKLVLENNEAYQSNKLESEIAREEIGVSKVRPNPELEVAYRDNTEDHTKLGAGVEGGVSWDLEFGGKRKSRINYAKKAYELSKMELEDYTQNLRLEASLIYLTAIKEQQLYEVQKASYEAMLQIAKSDSIQHALGILTRVDALRTRVEASMAKNEMIQAHTEWQNSILRMQDFAGNKQETYILIPDTDTKLLIQRVDLEQLKTSALENKATLKASLLNKEQTQAEEKRIRADRRMDLSLIAGIEYNKAKPSIEAPMDKVLTLGIAFPLKFSNLNKAELRQIEFAKNQADWDISATRRETISSVIEAYNRFVTAQQQLESLEEELLAEGQNILNAVIYAYQRGSTSFLEVLHARNSYNEIQTLYYESQYDYSTTYLELLYAAGITQGF